MAFSQSCSPILLHLPIRLWCPSIHRKERERKTVPPLFLNDTLSLFNSGTIGGDEMNLVIPASDQYKLVWLKMPPTIFWLCRENDGRTTVEKLSQVWLPREFLSCRSAQLSETVAVWHGRHQNANLACKQHRCTCLLWRAVYLNNFHFVAATETSKSGESVSTSQLSQFPRLKYVWSKENVCYKLNL